MSLGIERLPGLCGQGGQTDAAGNVAANVLELADLPRQLRLTGLDRRLEQRVDLIEDADDDLEPLGFGAAEFIGLEAQMSAFGIVGLLQKIGEVGHFGGHALGKFFGCLNGFGGGVLDDLPLGRGIADLAGQLVEFLDFFDRVGQGLGLKQSSAVGGALQERSDERPRAQGRAKNQAASFPPKQRPVSLPEYEKPDAKKKRIRDQERPERRVL